MRALASPGFTMKSPAYRMLVMMKMMTLVTTQVTLWLRTDRTKPQIVIRVARMSRRSAGRPAHGRASVSRNMRTL